MTLLSYNAFIDGIEEDTFEVRFREGGELFQVTLSIEDVAPENREMLVLGAYLHLTLTPEGASIIWCRETWSAEQLAQAKFDAKKLFEDLGWGEPLVEVS